MEELLKNSALIGLLGVIIGSTLSLFGIMYSERIKLKTIELQQKQGGKETLEKNFVAFLHLINQYQDFYLSKMISFNQFMSNEDGIALIKSGEKILAELDIRTSKELSMACHELFSKTFTSIFDNKAYSEQYRIVLDLMKTELEKFK